jgi:hypothetical protein
MAASEGNPTQPIDTSQTGVTPAPAVPPAPLDDRATIDLRDTVRSEPSAPSAHTVDLRDTVLVPAQGGPAVAELPPAEVLRFGPGVPAVLATAPVLVAAQPPAPPRRLRRDRAVNLALTLALAAVVVWLLWPAGALRVRSVSVKAAPTLVTCEKTADVIATVSTNGNAGRLTYRWTRNDGVGSGTLVQSLARGQHSVDLHLTWAFHGPGSYDARATVRLLSPGAQSATVNFSYVC